MPWKRAIDDVEFTQKVTGRAGSRAACCAISAWPATRGEGAAPAFSGGMLQRVNFASAIAHDPEVLLMGRPFSALDEMKREEKLGLWLGAQLAARPKTVLFVARREAVFADDRVIVFSPSPGHSSWPTSPSPDAPLYRRVPHHRAFVRATDQIRGLLFGQWKAAAVKGSSVDRRIPCHACGHISATARVLMRDRLRLALGLASKIVFPHRVHPAACGCWPWPSRACQFRDPASATGAGRTGRKPASSRSTCWSPKAAALELLMANVR